MRFWLLLGVAYYLAFPLTNALAETRDTLRINVPYVPTNLNPILSTTVYQQFLGRLFDDPLISTDADGTMTPMLARDVPTLANGGISRDGLRVTYRLRPGIRWQDDTPFTSRDIAFTWRAIMSPQNTVSQRQAYAVVRSIDTPDPLTVVVHLKHKMGPFVAEFFTTIFPLPEHLLGRQRELNDVPFNSLPVGLGPFRVVRWDRGSQIVLDANDAYYFGRPALRHIVIRMATDENTAELELRSHSVDVLEGISSTSYSHLRDVAGFATILENINASASLTMLTTRSPLSDVRLRRAIALAIDRKAIAEKVGFGSITPSNGADITKASWAYDASLPPQPFDPAAAKALVQTVTGGKPLHLTLVYSANYRTAETAALLIAEMLRPTGIELQLKAVDSTILFAPAAQGGILLGGNFELALSGFQDFNDPDNSPQYSCETVAPAGFNFARYCTPDLRRLQTEALTSYDRSVRKRAYVQIERLILRDVPADVIYWQHFIDAYSTDVHGLESRPGYLSPYRYRWSIGTN